MNYDQQTLHTATLLEDILDFVGGFVLQVVFVDASDTVHWCFLARAMTLASERQTTAHLISHLPKELLNDER